MTHLTLTGFIINTFHELNAQLLHFFVDLNQTFMLLRGGNFSPSGQHLLYEQIPATLMTSSALLLINKLTG